MTGSHDGVLVVLAILIAVAASYTALDLASRISAAISRTGSLAWLAAAAVCMGGGIWSMHFVAMLAHGISGMEVSYDPGLTIISLLTAIVVTGVGFSVAAKPDVGRVPLVLSGLFMGAGILAMHYTGMAAMKMHADLRYDVLWVAVSVVIAMAASIAALWLAFRSTGFLEKAVAAPAMGLAISGMHFAGMKAASFDMHVGTDVPMADGVDQGALALAIAAITFVILFAAIIAAMFDRRFAALASNEALALRRSEEQFRSLYRLTPLPLHSLDEQGRIEDVSDAWTYLLGYGRGEVIGRPLIDFMTEDSARQRLADWPKLLDRGELREREYRLVTRTGALIDVLSTSRVERDGRGAFVRAVGGLVDVTARKQAEEALRQAQKMEAVGQLTGGVAHDFNNILAIVLGNLELIRRRMPQEDRLLRMVDNAIEGARRGATLTQRMLSFARRQSLNPQAVDVGALVAGMHDLLERSLGPGLTFATEFAAPMPQVHVDPHQLEMALLNLVVNARDAMEGGTITIAADAPRVVPATLAPGRYVRISVADTGEGMDEATLARAREPFFTTKEVGRGTGLGLSMVNGFAEQSGGTLVIDSARGRGTTVEIWLPAADAGDVAAEVAAPASGADMQDLLQGKTVLVVDDEVLVRLGTEALLQDLGVETLSAGTGSQALELLDQNRQVACVVTDYAMPGMTGAELAAAIKARSPDLPIIIATGYAEVPEEIAAYPMLQKPFSEMALAEAVATALVSAQR